MNNLKPPKLCASFRFRIEELGCKPVVVHLVPRFLLVPEGKHKHGINICFVSVQRDIAGISEADHQFSQFRQIINGPANFRVRFQEREMPLDGLTGSSRCHFVFLGQKLAAAD